MAAKNASDGLSLLKVVENATNDVTDMLQRIRELAVQAKSGTNSSNDVGNLQLEANALMDEITRVSDNTTFNGVTYIGSGAGEVSIQVGYNDNDSIGITTYSVSATALGLRSEGTAEVAEVTDDDGTVTTEYAAAVPASNLDITSADALDTISDAINTVGGYKAEWGAGQNRLEYTVSNLMNVVEFTSAARSRIQDADFAVEAARLAKSQVLQQTGTAMLAQANASPQLAISLIS